MINNEPKFDFSETTDQAIPAAALCFEAECELGENASDQNDSATVRLRARSGDFIDHWFWGKIAHDLSGFKLTGNKRKLSILYEHSTPVGFALRKNISVDEEANELVVNGTFVKGRNEDTDLAVKVIDWMKGGIPFESSISFAGGAPKLEIVEENQTAEVNGREFKGPGVIVREWSLREVSIVTSGADPETESALFNAQTVSVEFISKENETMPKTEHTQPNEDALVNTENSVDLSAVNDSAEGVADTATQPVDAHTLSVEDILAPYRRLGPEGLQLAAEGLDLQEATERVLESQRVEIDKLKSENAALRAMGGGEDEAVGASFGASDGQQGGKFPKPRKADEARSRTRPR